MKWQNNTKAYQLIEKLVIEGKSLPIDQARADAILNMREAASAEDIRVLQEAVKKI